MLWKSFETFHKFQESKYGRKFLKMLCWHNNLQKKKKKSIPGYESVSHVGAKHNTTHSLRPGSENLLVTTPPIDYITIQLNNLVIIIKVSFGR